MPNDRPKGYQCNYLCHFDFRLIMVGKTDPTARGMPRSAAFLLMFVTLVRRVAYVGRAQPSRENFCS
jgi:hypothetical protein